MTLFYYRQNILEKLYKTDTSSQIMQFLEDMKQVYPRYVNGEKNGLRLKTIDTPTVLSDNLEKYIPPEKIPREINEIEEEIDNDTITDNDEEDNDWDEND